MFKISMKEQTKRIILWVVFIFFIYCLLNTVFAMFDFPHFLSYLEQYGVDISSTGTIRTVIIFWFLVDAGVVFYTYKKLFTKKQDKTNTPKP
jgi:hypothetical protein